jgi:hypothetical protein
VLVCVSLLLPPIQVALTRVGYYCGDDEMRWWQFGEATANALKTFQVGGLALSPSFP